MQQGTVRCLPGGALINTKDPCRHLTRAFLTLIRATILIRGVDMTGKFPELAVGQAGPDWLPPNVGEYGLMIVNISL